MICRDVTQQYIISVSAINQSIIFPCRATGRCLSVTLSVCHTLASWYCSEIAECVELIFWHRGFPRPILHVFTIYKELRVGRSPLGLHPSGTLSWSLDLEKNSPRLVNVVNLHRTTVTMQFITPSIYLCAQRHRRDTTRRTGPFASADFCNVDNATRQYAGSWFMRCILIYSYIANSEISLFGLLWVLLPRDARG